jgi:hypothetical protein
MCGRFTQAYTWQDTRQEGERRSMADVGDPEAGDTAADTFTLRLTTAMLVTVTRRSRWNQFSEVQRRSEPT